MSSEDVTMKPTLSASSGQIPSDQQIPRRASKRLAGIKADMKPVLSASSGQIPSDQQIPSRASKRLAGIKADMKPTLSASSGQIPRDQQIPRRASKRIAGIKADLPQELKRTRARRDVVKQPREDETVIIADKSTNSLPNNQAKQFNALDSPEPVINADASLPPGWTVNVKVRKNGHKDKYYFPPSTSSEKKFNSMVGVLRYLDKAKNKPSLQSSSNNLEDVTTKPTLSVSSGQNSGLDKISSGEQIPRRSKRLAGFKADQLKTTQASGDVVKQSGEDKTIINADRSTNKVPNDQVKPFNALDGSEAKFNNKSAENTMENNATEKDCVRVLENGDNAVAKLDHRCDCDSPLQVILTDPCIAFAVQTLTGETFETSKDTQISSELKTVQNCETSAEEHSKKIIAMCDDSDRRNMFSSPESFAIEGNHVDIAQIDNAHKNAGPSEKKLDISKMAVSTVNLCKRLQSQPAVW